MKKVNVKVIVLNLIALVFIVLMFLIDWLFIIPAVIFTGWGYRYLFEK